MAPSGARVLCSATVVEAPVSSMDVFPTILDYLGISIPETDGVSLRPLVEGNPVERDVVSFFAWPEQAQLHDP